MNFIGMESAQKLRGGYYTPPDLAAFLVRWISEINPKAVLEPSCGDGVFFDAVAKTDGFSQTTLTGFELNQEEAAKATSRVKTLGLKKTSIYADDFLEWSINNIELGKQSYDAVIGNPPFIRYQYLPQPFQLRAEKIFKQLALPFTKHTNAWVPFILASIALLRPGGRLAMVVPAEIMHVTHAQSLRSYLGRECRRLVIVDPQELWFSDTLQGAVLLLAEKKLSEASTCEGLGMYPVRNREFLNLKPNDVFNAPQSINGKTVAGKWTRALLNTETRAIFDELGEHPEVHLFNDIAQVDVGIVTGANKYFLVTDEVVEEYNLSKWAHPMFGRSQHCPGIIYDSRQHKANAKKGDPTNFLWFNDDIETMSQAAKAYLKLGEMQELHTRYKCRIRSPWYKVPSVYATEIGMLKRSHDMPRLILNKIGAYTTDTAYRIRSNVAADKLVGCFINPLTALSAELEGRHYGGGVLELIPSEIERLALPVPIKAKIDLTALDKTVRNISTHQYLAEQGKIILGALGLSKTKQELILEGWQHLRDRRHRTLADNEAELDAA